jgi:hypothetical protein
MPVPVYATLAHWRDVKLPAVFLFRAGKLPTSDRARSSTYANQYQNEKKQIRQQIEETRYSNPFANATDSIADLL